MRRSDGGLAEVTLRLGVRIALRDGVRLSANVYLPRSLERPAPAVFHLTPYGAQSTHDVGLRFAAQGYPFLSIDVRGRGNSEGEFEPHVNEARDGHDVVEWLAGQPYCNGMVAMWGGSYGGYVQWATAKEFPPHLTTIVPVASPCYGVDLPFRGNVFLCHRISWLARVWGRGLQGGLLQAGDAFLTEQLRRFFESGRPFKTLDTFCFGEPSAVFQRWVAHPRPDEYWDSRNPTPEQYARLTLPILTLTGCYDEAQLGALEHYSRHMKHGSPEARARHYLVIGPWDHIGTRSPQLEFGGIRVGPRSLIDLTKLHCEWYAWTMQQGPRPEFLKKRVACYVMGAEEWRYADTLEEVTVRHEPLHLHASANPVDVFRSGSLAREAHATAEPDCYHFDPRDVSAAALESTVDPADLTDQRLIHALSGKQLVYHSAPFDEDVEISGFFKLVLWIAIDQPDTDIRVRVYEIDSESRSLLLSETWMRARHRENLRRDSLVSTQGPLRYDFERFPFISRVVRKEHRLRLVIGPIHSIHCQKNYNSGKVVAEERVADARTVTVRLYHDATHVSTLYVPIGRTEVA